MRIIDLFAGIGGLSEGVKEALKESGHTPVTVFTSEIKTAAIHVLKNREPNLVINGDIQKIHETDIPAHDFLLAGFPCQAFSHAGSRQGFQDPTKGTLFFDVLRILKHHKPRYFILENVEGLLTHDKPKKDWDSPYGRTFTTILEELQNAGYHVEWELLEATEFDVPQRRRRVFIVGSTGATNWSSNLSQLKTSSVPPIKSIIKYGQKETDPRIRQFSKLILETFSPKEVEGRMLRDKRHSNFYFHSWDFGARGKCTKDEQEFMNIFSIKSKSKTYSKLYNIRYQEGMAIAYPEIKKMVPHLSNLQGILDSLTKKGHLRLEDKGTYIGYRMVGGLLSYPITHVLDSNKPVQTLTATDSSRMVIVDGKKLRRFTRGELKLLFGFTKNQVSFKGLPETKVFDLLGNTVIPLVAKNVALALIETKEEDTK